MTTGGGYVWRGHPGEEPAAIVADFDQGQADAIAALRAADVFYLVTVREGHEPEAHTCSKATWPVRTMIAFFASASRFALEVGETILQGDGEVEL